MEQKKNLARTEMIFKRYEIEVNFNPAHAWGAETVNLFILQNSVKT
jgi:hypothetical protein